MTNYLFYAETAMYMELKHASIVTLLALQKHFKSATRKFQRPP